MWLTPPHMKSEMTDLARAGKCGPSAASLISPASAQSAPSATPRKPPPAWWRNARRETRPQGKRSGPLIARSPRIKELIEVEQQPREALQPARVSLQVRHRRLAFGSRRATSDGHAVTEVDRRAEVAAGVALQPLGEFLGRPVDHLAVHEEQRLRRSD